jgi:excinuclease ABC subunit C
MISQAIKNLIAKLPDTPGVYFFKQKSGAILYIGKATSLRDRVRSYFSQDIATTRGPKIVAMLEAFADIDFQQTDSVLEALILEANLIKKYQPPYNTAQKDNKSFSYVVITKEDYPRVLLARGRDIEMTNYANDIEFTNKGQKGEVPYKIAHSFGPFPQGSAIKEGLVLIRKIFPYRDTCIPNSGRPCFNRQIGLCPGVCTGEISKEEYKQTMKNIVEFFKGNKKAVIKNLEKQMKEFAKDKEFEKAGEIKHRIFALNHIRDISLIKQENIHEKSGLIYRIEAYDVAHMSGKDVVGVMTVVENGTAQKSEYRKFKIKLEKNNDVGSLKEMLRRRLNHDEWRLPNLIVVDGAAAQKNAAEAVLLEYGYQIPVMAITKDEYHRPKNILGDRMHLVHDKEMLLANNEAHRQAIAYHKKLRDRIK